MTNDTGLSIKHYPSQTICWIEYDNHKYYVVGGIQPEVNGSYWKAPEDCEEGFPEGFCITQLVDVEACEDVLLSVSDETLRAIEEACIDSLKKAYQDYYS